MSIFKDALYGTKPVASEEEADRAAENACGRLRYDSSLTEARRQQYMSFVTKYAREVAQLRFSKFEEEVESVISSGYYSSNDDLYGRGGGGGEYLNSNLVKQARLDASRRHHGLK